MSPLIVNGLTEKELIKRCLSGDRLAQKEMFCLYSGKMMAICLRYSRHRLEAEDILQDSFIKVFTHLSEYRNDGGSLEGWIKRITINTAIKSSLKKSLEYKEIGPDQLQEEFIGPDIFSTLSEEELIKLISSLPSGYRMVFNLHAIEGFSHKEIGELLYIEESTSRSQLTKARRMLQQKVNQLHKAAV
jgi:RNA polymerase sigma-70 factor (ECF subfamily)